MNDKKLTHEDVVSLLSGKMSRKEMDNLFKNFITPEHKNSLLKDYYKYLDNPDKLKEPSFGRGLDIGIKLVNVSKNYKMSEKKSLDNIQRNINDKNITKSEHSTGSPFDLNR